MPTIDIYLYIYIYMCVDPVARHVDDFGAFA